MPEDTVSKLNAVLSGLIARPQPPSRPDIVRLDELQKELDHAKQLQDPVARMAAITQGYDNWRREYDKFLGSVNPTPTASFIPPLPPKSPPPGSGSASQTDENASDEETTEAESDAGSYTQEDKIKLEPRFTCPECLKNFGSQSARTRHAKSKHGIWLGKGSTPQGLQRLKTETGGAKTGRGIVFYPASSRR